MFVGKQVGVNYTYEVGADRRTFEFSLPLEPASAAASGATPPLKGSSGASLTSSPEMTPFPFTFGLVADLGQTAVSAANVHGLVRLMRSHAPRRLQRPIGRRDRRSHRRGSGSGTRRACRR